MEEASRTEGQDEGERMEVEDGAEGVKENRVADSGSKESQEMMEESESMTEKQKAESETASRTDNNIDAAEQQKEGDKEANIDMPQGQKEGEKAGEEGNKDSAQGQKEGEKEKEGNQDTAGQMEEEKEGDKDLAQEQKEREQEKESNTDMAGQNEGKKAEEESNTDMPQGQKEGEKADTENEAGKEGSHKDSDGSKDGAGQEGQRDSEPNANDSVEAMECEDESSASKNGDGVTENEMNNINVDANNDKDNTDDTSNMEQACTNDPFAEDSTSNKETEKQDSSKNSEKQSEVSTSAKSASQKESEKPKENEDKKDKDDDEIIELEVVKKPAELVDLAEDEEGDPIKAADKEGESQNNTEDNNKGIKLRPFASLLGNENQEKNGESCSTESTISAPTPSTESLPMGEILEHGHIIGSAEIGGLQLRISNVIGGEDCITGLSADEDRDAFSNIQIASVTTLMDPTSPEDPNKEPTMEQSSDQNTSQGQTETATDMETQDSSEGGIKIVNSESLAGKTVEDGDKDDSAGGKIQLSSAVSEVAKDASAEDTADSENVYQIVKNVLTVSRICQICTKAAVCEYRVKKKKSTYTFLCTQECKTKWVENIPSGHTIEKARIIFEKLCGMCGKDLSTLVRKQQFSWETREFCSQNCLTLHLNEVAGECHSCHAKVGCLFIGKYCVRFGSDIHQFCSNACLEFYKGKIKVCCYCQKNLQEVTKVMSTSNKEYCSSKCLKRTQRRDIGQQNYNEKLKCTVCQGINVNRYEFLLNGEPHMLCSEPCLNVYKYVNKVKAVACCLCFRVLNAEEVGHYLFHGGHQLRVFCSDSCVNVFILSARKIVVCDSCKVKKYNFDMIHKQIDDEFKVCYYCSLNCLQNADSINKGIIPSTTTATNTFLKSTNAIPDQNVTACNMCSTLAKAQYHMVMSDNTLRSFCCYECASKFKKNFGFIVDGVQTVNSGQLLIRPKPTSQLTNNVSQTGDDSTNKKNASTEATQNALKRDHQPQSSPATAADLIQLLTPPLMVNKMTSCKPTTCTKGVYCKPHPWHKSTQTDPSEKLESEPSICTKDLPPILPVPVPVYVPSPMMMYNAPFPVPIFVPVPLPVPIFIPTTGKTTQDIQRMMAKIRDEMPSDPYEAEMLILARQHQKQDEEEKLEEDKKLEENEEEPKEDKEDSEELQNNSANFDAGELDDNFFGYQENEGIVHDELLNTADVTCLDTIEEDLPRYTLRLPGSADGNQHPTNESQENTGKRPLPQSSERPSKRVRRSSNGSPMTSDPDDVEEAEPVMEPAPEQDPILEEELPYLNKMYGLAAWKRWVTGKNAELAGVSSSRSMKLVPEDLLTMNCEELNYSLCLFLKDLRKPNGKAYQPDTVFYLLLGIQQHLFESSRTDCIFMDFGFEKFTNSLEEITKTFLDSLPSPELSPSCGLGVTRITESMLWECRQLGAHTPQVLLNTLFYFNTKVFKLRTVQEHMNMSFVQIVKQWRRSSYGEEGSVTRTSLLKYYPKKSHLEDTKSGSTYEMHENKEDPLRCPVKLYEFYLSKCPESVRNQRNVYYVYPERSCVPDSPVWFSMQAVQANNISKMLHRALMVKEVQEALAE